MLVEQLDQVLEGSSEKLLEAALSNPERTILSTVIVKRPRNRRRVRDTYSNPAQQM